MRRLMRQYASMMKTLRRQDVRRNSGDTTSIYIYERDSASAGKQKEGQVRYAVNAAVDKELGWYGHKGQMLVAIPADQKWFLGGNDGKDYCDGEDSAHSAGGETVGRQESISF